MKNKKLKDKIILGDVRKVHRQITDDSFQCIITSPPYFGHRKYSSEEEITSVKEIARQKMAKIVETQIFTTEDGIKLSTPKEGIKELYGRYHWESFVIHILQYTQKNLLKPVY